VKRRRCDEDDSGFVEPLRSYAEIGLYQRQASALYFSVIAGLDPAIQLVELNRLFKMDARVEPAHDESITVAPGITYVRAFGRCRK
jgi:hypothetical protein